MPGSVTLETHITRGSGKDFGILGMFEKDRKSLTGGSESRRQLREERDTHGRFNGRKSVNFPWEAVSREL